jgi:putative oxidoreductase
MSIVRLVADVLMAARGGQKLFGWFGGYGLAVGRVLRIAGLQTGTAVAAAAGFSELVGRLLIALGFLGPVGPALVLAVMIVAAVSVHWRNGLFAGPNGIEPPLLISAVPAMLTFSGPGRIRSTGCSA